jgi:hypothetical protein
MVEFVARLETLIAPYCAELAAILVAEESPVEFDNDNAPAVKSELVNEVIPATAMSIYCVRPLLVVSPQVPDSVPVTGRGRFKRVVRLTVIASP